MTATNNISVNPVENNNAIHGEPVVQWHYADMQRTLGVQFNRQSAASEKSIYYDMLTHLSRVLYPMFPRPGIIIQNGLL